MLNGEEESVMKASSREEGRIIAQSRFDVNEEIPSVDTSRMRVMYRYLRPEADASLYGSKDRDGAVALLTAIGAGQPHSKRSLSHEKNIGATSVRPCRIRSPLWEACASPYASYGGLTGGRSRGYKHSSRIPTGIVWYEGIPSIYLWNHGGG